MTAALWSLGLVICYVILCVTSSPIAEKSDKEIDEKIEEKRSGYPCIVGGQVFQHGQLFSYPGFSTCIKYRCYNGGFSVVQGACDRSGQCVPEGSTIRDGCRSLRCTRETRNNMNYYRLEPTAQDRCDADGTCVQKNVPFEHVNCQTYRCVGTTNGGYRFEFLGIQKCRDDHGRCLNVGSTYSKWVNGQFYRRCTCLPGGAHRCMG